MWHYNIIVFGIFFFFLKQNKQKCDEKQNFEINDTQEKSRKTNKKKTNNHWMKTKREILSTERLREENNIYTEELYALNSISYNRINV